METPYILTLITVPNRERAEAIAEALIQERWAACVNILPSVHSLFFWQGARQKEEEWLLLAKSRRVLFASLAARVKELHPYSVPEIIALPILEGSEEYLQWVEEATARQGDR
jgi:periplasmic divalent cation tolerance protein